MKTLFTNVTALLMDEAFTTLQDGFVAVEGTDISYVGPARPQGSFDETIDCAGKVMMPGFVNCHTHIPMTLMRGYGGGHDLQSWLNDFIFPAEDRWDDRSLAAAAGLGLAEGAGVSFVQEVFATGEVVRRLEPDAAQGSRGPQAVILLRHQGGGVFFGIAYRVEQNIPLDLGAVLAVGGVEHVHPGPPPADGKGAGGGGIALAPGGAHHGLDGDGIIALPVQLVEPGLHVRQVVADGVQPLLQLALLVADVLQFQCDVVQKIHHHMEELDLLGVGVQAQALG